MLLEWHVRSGHASKGTVIQMMSVQVVAGMPRFSKGHLLKVSFFCHACAEMKSKRMSFRSKEGSRDDRPLSTVHMHNNGPMKVLGLYDAAPGAKYIVTLIDDKTTWRWSFILTKRVKSLTK